MLPPVRESLLRILMPRSAPIRRVFSHALREEIGQSMVELSLTLPLLIFGILGGADLGRALAIQLAVQNGARAGAEAYAIDNTPTTTEAQSAALAEVNRTPTVQATGSNVTVTEKQADGVTNCVHPPTIANPCYVTVRVQYTFRTVVPWPLIPNTANFDRSTQFRVFY
jgi:Flp pilus assembly protein TadG